MNATSDPFAIDQDACRLRQGRLLERMEASSLDAVVVADPANIQWLTGFHLPWVFSSIAWLTADGRLTLTAPMNMGADAAADELVHYDASRHCTLRNDQLEAASTVLMNALPKERVGRLGCELSRAPGHLVLKADQASDIESALFELRRCKMPDELRMIRKAISATEQMYERARQIIEPGISEIEVFNQLQGVVVEEFGEPMTRTGNDYQCGSRGGPPRANRIAAAGELYILDLGPAFRGYFADNARTIAVTQPSDVQQEAWTRIQEVFRFVESTVKPGVSAFATFQRVQEMLDQAPVGVFDHHLGHGIGLFPHEAPHLNPNWRDTFEEGDVFTAEPGLYAQELEAGMRIENNYLVTTDGVELLTDFSLEL